MFPKHFSSQHRTVALGVPFVRCFVCPSTPGASAALRSAWPRRCRDVSGRAGSCCATGACCRKMGRPKCWRLWDLMENHRKTIGKWWFNGDLMVIYMGYPLVGGIPTPPKNMNSSVGMMTFPICGKIKVMFQTTNQYGIPSGNLT